MIRLGQSRVANPTREPTQEPECEIAANPTQERQNRTRAKLEVELIRPPLGTELDTGQALLSKSDRHWRQNWTRARLENEQIRPPLATELDMGQAE